MDLVPFIDFQTFALNASRLYEMQDVKKYRDVSIELQIVTINAE